MTVKVVNIDGHPTLVRETIIPSNVVDSDALEDLEHYVDWLIKLNPSEIEVGDLAILGYKVNALRDND